MRRYTNTTLQISHTLSTGVAYNPAASVPALSLAPVQGITTLPFSVIAEAATESVNDPAIPTTGVQSFKYDPVESDITQQNPANAPTSFWTFGDENRKSTVTLTSTSIVYQYTKPSSQAEQPAGLQSSQQNAGPNLSGNATTTTCEKSMSQTSVLTHEPVPTTDASTIETTSALPGSTSQISSISTTQTAESSTTASSTTSAVPPKETQATTSRFAYPYPDEGTTSAIAQNDNADSSASAALPMMSSDASNDLPEVVIGNTQSQKHKQYDGDLATTGTSLASLPGITIVPQNPSVIYITVTEPGVTTTVTA